MLVERADNFMASLGIEVYRVGGSVRDELLGRPVKDTDYMVRGIDLGDLFDLVKAQGHDVRVSVLKLRDGRPAGVRAARKGMGVLEIVLPRTEISTGPGHRDFEIVVAPDLSLEDDAIRRDFTFNALYREVGAEDMDGIHDPTGRGLYDLQHKLVNTTHADSFRDDPLRTLRALRFVSVLGYDLGTATEAQMMDHAEHVTGLSINGYASGTVLDELSKILMGDDVRKALRLARDTGVLATLIPELAPMLGFDQDSRFHDMTADEHTFATLDVAAHVDAPLRVRMALLFHDSGKPEAAWVGDDGRKHYYSHVEHYTVYDEEHSLTTEDHADVSERLWREFATRAGSPRDMREDVAILVRDHMVGLTGKLKEAKVRRMRVRYGDDLLRDLLMHRACDVSGKGRVNTAYLQRLADMERVRQEACDAGVPSRPRDLEITGHDLMALGAEGPEIGRVQKALLDEVVSQPTETTLSRDWQLYRAADILDS
jgi:tRNA nucleotidyltransferase (CCA-adding enzyme)